MKEKIQEIIGEWGQLHRENCDAISEELYENGCNCAVKNYTDEIVEAVVEHLSHDIFDNEEQRKAGVKMYLEAYNEQ